MVSAESLIADLRAYLDPRVPESLMRGDLTLLRYQLPALKAVQEEMRCLLSIELEGSGSLNRRGTQLAASCGLILALLANVAREWSSPDSLDVVGVLTFLAVLPLASAAGCALYAVTPQSKWREELYAVIGELVEGRTAELDARSERPGAGDQQEELAVRAQATRRLAGILELQRETNETKAYRMRWAYLLFAVGVMFTVIEVLLLPMLAR